MARKKTDTAKGLTEQAMDLAKLARETSASAAPAADAPEPEGPTALTLTPTRAEILSWMLADALYSASEQDRTGLTRDRVLAGASEQDLIELARLIQERRRRYR